eukprot:CAMPEP_0175045920 /NCGR_PEP_ID=MMETSP0052_2-20121109/4731_1 /TAXON_ID=51329 ORGANISM="Polytomella parva, Strain SAG 63-3" /NCGR_SAMPLE_ID=MMETSP0052_2 /ASSEMBLY_ACC=CAM_ASM_000194 /LENGTH=115 /DNA_ID=CAMNT_0016309585 /DNA_START=565 /DNA_END=912 /DNA_ORIENTATION=+
MDHIAAGKEGLPQKNLGEDAPDRPNIDGRGVLGVEGPAELGGSVPSGGHVIGPENGGGQIDHCGTRQAKIADLQLAIRVGQNVLGLQVAVEHLGGVNIFQAAKHLVKEKLVMFGS